MKIFILEIHNAHESAVWDLAWHPMGHILCSGSNDHTTKFWCRNRPGDTGRDKQAGYIQGSGEQNPAVPGRPFQTEGPTTPGPFAAGGTMRVEGTIPGVGAAMPFSLPTMDTTQSEPPQQSMLGSGPQGVHPGGPHPPFAPHPSIATSSQQMYQQTQQIPTQQLQQHQMFPQLQQSTTLPPQPPNLQQQLQQPQNLQGPPMHLALHAHPPPPPPRQPLQQPQQLGMPSTMPSSMPSTLPSAPMLHSSQYSSMVPLSGQLAQGSSNQMRPQISQSHALGLSSIHPGHVNGSSLPTGIGGFGNGISNVLESQNTVSGAPSFPTNTVGMQLQAPGAIAPTSGVYNRPQGGPLQTSSITPGLHTYQTTAPPNMMDMRGPGTNLGTNVGLGMGMGMGVPPHPRGPAPP
ncbi:hypothetical protein KI387_021514, partial [Taxus chinensis]